jgi:hypothetical protein
MLLRPQMQGPQRKWEENVTSPANHSVLPDTWVEKLFQRFEDFYGAKWAAQYGGFPRERVKKTWATELSRFAGEPDRIAFAIRSQLNSPFPPTLPEFMALCRQAPSAAKPAALLEHKPTPEQRERNADAAASMQRAVSKASGFDYLAWAKRPRSQAALDMVRRGAMDGDSRLKSIIDDLVRQGIATADGKLLRAST